MRPGATINGFNCLSALSVDDGRRDRSARTPAQARAAGVSGGAVLSDQTLQYIAVTPKAGDLCIVMDQVAAALLSSTSGINAHIFGSN